MKALPLIYRSPLLYRLLMQALYVGHARQRFDAIAECVEAGSSVLDVCCGPGLLGSHLHARRGVAYVGVDISAAFVEAAVKRKLDVRIDDARAALRRDIYDYVVMQSSLYQFHPNESEIVEAMLGAARRAVIISEPVRNLSSSRLPLLRAICRKLTATDTGKAGFRFTEATLDSLLQPWRSRVLFSCMTAGGREKLYVLSAAHEDKQWRPTSPSLSRSTAAKNACPPSRSE